MSSETDMEVESPHVENTHTELLWVLWVMYFLDVTFWIHFHWTEGQFRWLERYNQDRYRTGNSLSQCSTCVYAFLFVNQNNYGWNVILDQLKLLWLFDAFVSETFHVHESEICKHQTGCSWIPWKLLESVKIGIFKIVFFYQYKFSAL